MEYRTIRGTQQQEALFPRICSDGYPDWGDLWVFRCWNRPGSTVTIAVGAYVDVFYGSDVGGVSRVRTFLVLALGLSLILGCLFFSSASAASQWRSFSSCAVPFFHDLYFIRFTVFSP